MPDVAFYRDLYAYNRKVLENFLRRLEKLPAREAERDRGSGHGSLVHTFLHIVRVHDAWLNYLLKGDLEGLRASRERHSRMHRVREARAYFRASWKGIDRTLRGMTAAKLRAPAKAPWMPGTYTVEDALVQ